MKTPEEYDLEYFIKKFEAIPEELWNMGSYVNKDNPKCMCAYGHCGFRDKAESSPEGAAISKILMELDESWSYKLAEINDGLFIDSVSFGSTPKHRVVNYLKSLRS